MVTGGEKNNASGKAGGAAADPVAAAPHTAILKRAPALLFRPVRPDPHFSAQVSRSESVRVAIIKGLNNRALISWFH